MIGNTVTNMLALLNITCLLYINAFSLIIILRCGSALDFAISFCLQVKSECRFPRLRCKFVSLATPTLCYVGLSRIRADGSLSNTSWSG